jgi:hydrogenase expression/formation protein HypC
MTARFRQTVVDRNSCVTCDDVAVSMRVLEISGATATVIDPVGRTTEVAIDFVPQAQPGDKILVHVGVAIGCVRGTP